MNLVRLSKCSLWKVRQKIDPLFCILFIGPLFFSFTLLFSTSLWAHPLLPSLSMISFAATWCLPRPRLFFFFSPILLYLALAFLYHEIDLFLLGESISLCLALFLCFLSLQEVKEGMRKKEVGQEDKFEDLAKQFHEIKLIHLQKEEEWKKEGSRLSFEVTQAEKKAKAFSLLVHSSDSEAQKTFQQNQALSAQALQLHRDCVLLKEQLEEEKQRISDLKIQYARLEKTAQERLNQLNSYRVEDYQKALLLREAGNYEKNPLSGERKSDSIKWKELEKKKKDVKKEYQSILEEAKGLEDHFRQLLKKLEKNPSKEEELDVNERKIQYRKELSEKKAQLEELKKTYLDIEKESFLIRKELHQEGCFI